ncbi:MULTISPECIES: hypothetical protein [Flavobacterium]|jgi:hypothetical protein|uniref:Uncharacterized protein n=1 Tax=Flavobacterium tructae TaxID=1114873 RepID=A0A1S1J4F8_9FLAO|nr:MULTISPECIES: hypothetical protein [Flavobacterium]MDL2142066.1 hypothetical protein [Flavobacterium tructae]OHT45542.1 hypothetical protein BHE19_06815 [Flavobacterium tructae]OXB18199.1 hypothetical protein B0A71_14835 [Flavobacterium tructae]OXB21345.1 hypothetical protein B0A80_17565 [Flavobacterium tructae]URC10858.1 hypothetical protein M4I44_12225 [Flavobacterium sp. B183]
MKELDLLKKDWKKNSDSFEQISEKEIYKMIHKKSSSIVKWILIISILEVLFWTISNYFSNVDADLKKMNHPEIILVMDILLYFNYIVIFVFIYFFYKNYKTITTTVSTKLLMSSILKTRKTVQYYVWYNLGMLVVSSILSFFIGYVYNPDMAIIREKLALNGKAMLFSIGALVLLVLVLFGIFWGIYRLLYGTLLRRLYANYKELKKIDF